MDAAEEVFGADSHAVALALRLIPPHPIDPMALTAIGMVTIADGFHRDADTANAWLLKHLAGKAAASTDRSVTDQVAVWVANGSRPDGTDLPAALLEAWQARRAALVRYRRALPEDADTDHILSALLHMHHNRARRIDRTDEATCLRLARQAALTRRARNAENIP